MRVKAPIPYLELRPHDPTSFHIRPLRPFIPLDEEAEVPHRHNFQEIMWVRSGKGRHAIDGNLLEIEAGTFYLIARGQVHQFLEGHELTGYLVRFTNDFLLDYATQTIWNYHVTLFSNVRLNMLPVVLEMRQSYEMLLSIMFEEHEQTDMFAKYDLLRHLLLTLLLKLKRLHYTIAQTTMESHDPQTAVVKAFLQSLERHYKQTHLVADYATELGVTPRQLSRILHHYLGRTAKTLIDDRLILDAKRYLRHTNCSVKEIAYLLGYKDPSYFCRVFKRHTGMTPQAYRE